MNSRNLTRLYALLLGTALLLAMASCGGGGGTPITTPGDGGDLSNGSGEKPPIIGPGDGPVVRPGQDGPQGGIGTGGSGGVTQPPQPGSWDFGDLIYHVPVDSEGKARVTVESFAPGQKAAFVAINMNPLFLDAHLTPDGSFPGLPASSYSFEADQVNKGASSLSATGGAAVGDYTKLSPESDYAVTSDATRFSIYEREARANGLTPFAVDATKTTSLLQKGEVLTFLNVEQITPKQPPIIPGEEDPDKDLSDLDWPRLYRSQDGRLVAVGQHCLIFLSTEINSGHPDAIRFTQARLNRMANEFDNNIFPIATAAFGPVKNYEESSVFRDLDRSIILTGDDFDNDGALTRTLPGSPDFRIGNEGKILIFIDNGAEGGFFTFGESIDPDTGQKALVGSTIYLGGDNFPTNDADFNAAFSVMAHEFQHKLYHDNNLPNRSTTHDWFNEGLSQLSLYMCGYTPNSGKLIHWAVDSQLSDYIQHTNSTAVPMDANPYFSKDPQYGSGLLFFLYMFEHYDPGVGRRIYQAASAGVTDRINLVEKGAQYTVDGVTHQDTFQQLYTKFAIANFVDGINANDQTQFDDRFHYDTIDLRGTVNLSTGTIQLPGVRVGVFPSNGAYPAIENDRLVIPWGVDYLVFGNGDGRDLDVQFSADVNYSFYMLPVSQPTDPVTGAPTSNKVQVNPDIQIGY
jgi:hypothetical protein